MGQYLNENLYKYEKGIEQVKRSVGVDEKLERVVDWRRVPG